jgi:hypothetical protein
VASVGNKKDAGFTPRLAESRFVASSFSGQTILLGRQRLGQTRKIEIEAKKANVLVHYGGMVTPLGLKVKNSLETR